MATKLRDLAGTAQPASEPPPRTPMFAVGAGTQLAVMPMHRGHHAIWASALMQADLCNQVDDLVVGDNNSGLITRFPIDRDLMDFLGKLFGAMDAYDRKSASPWAVHNGNVRFALLTAAHRRLTGNPPQRNIFEPGYVVPAIATALPVLADTMLAGLIRNHPPTEGVAGSAGILGAP